MRSLGTISFIGESIINFLIVLLLVIKMIALIIIDKFRPIFWLIRIISLLS